jgi:hypothetical protein
MKKLKKECMGRRAAALGTIRASLSRLLQIVLFLSLVTPAPTHAASVLIPLETCGITPAAQRNIVLTPVQAMGSNSIVVLDKIQGTTDGNGNWTTTLLPGVYLADVRPAWGAVGVTEFWFYVNPSNAVQNAYTNLLTGTNETYPPNNYAWSAQASDARYPMLPVTSNDVASINPTQIYPPVSGGPGNALTNAAATNAPGVSVGGPVVFVSTNYDAWGAATAAFNEITESAAWDNAVNGVTNSQSVATFGTTLLAATAAG